MSAIDDRINDKIKDGDVLTPQEAQYSQIKERNIAIKQGGILV